MTYQIFPPFSYVNGTKIKQSDDNKRRPKAQAGPPSCSEEQTMQLIKQGHIIRVFNVMIQRLQDAEWSNSQRGLGEEDGFFAEEFDEE